jgi:predicted 3-demethylubiquinone-9 3-methyltransferase (glyoxalase superfamily)
MAAGVRSAFGPFLALTSRAERNTLARHMSPGPDASILGRVSMAKSLTPFLMFVGFAEEAVNFYLTLFPDSKLRHIQRYEAGQMGKEGSVKRADVTLAGQDLICIDSPVKHAFTFTPSVSLFVECENETEFDTVVGLLAAGGSVLMPPGNYGFSSKFAWVNDRFGVSWQLNLE